MSLPTIRRALFFLLLLSGLNALPAAAESTGKESDEAPAAQSTVRGAPEFLPIALVPFGIGETMTFALGYGVINAGEATIAIEDTLTYFGQPVLQVVTRARSNRFFDAFFRVRDQGISYIDADSLFSRYYAKHLREGGYERDVEIHFDHHGGVAYYPDGKESAIPFGVHDVLSAFFRVRSLPLRNGDEIELPTHGDKRLYDLKVVVRRRETVDVDALGGEVRCVVVQPILKDEGIFQHSGELLVWFTDDERRIPVRMRADVPVGAIEANLKDYEPPRALAPALSSRRGNAPR